MTPKAGQIMWRPLRLLGCAFLLGLLILGRYPAAQATPEAAPSSEMQKPLVIACDRDNPPYTMLYPEGTPAGMFIDIWRLWAKKSGKRIEFRFTDLGESVASITTGAADIHSGLFATEDRTATMDFSQPFFESSSSLFFPLKSVKLRISRILKGKK